LSLDWNFRPLCRTFAFGEESTGFNPSLVGEVAVYSYVFKSAVGALNVDPKELGGIFGRVAGGTWEPLFWQWVAILVTGTVVMLGVARGIERVIKRLMPALLILLIICDIRALTLPGATAGISYLFRPDFTKITWWVVLTALGLSFFKLSIGMGAQLTYGSYMSKDENIPRTATRVALADTAVSLLAGLAVFPAVFAFGFKPDAGTSLLFITIPAVFQSMPLGRLFAVVFFLLASIAATGAMISLVEVPVAWASERFGISRKLATVLEMLLLALAGLPVTLSNGPTAGCRTPARRNTSISSSGSSPPSPSSSSCSVPSA
jgi:NSS family neurotransmitter:Na+ symporter